MFYQLSTDVTSQALKSSTNNVASPGLFSSAQVSSSVPSSPRGLSPEPREIPTPLCTLVKSTPSLDSAALILTKGHDPDIHASGISSSSPISEPRLFSHLEAVELRTQLAALMVDFRELQVCDG